MNYYENLLEQVKKENADACAQIIHLSLQESSASEITKKGGIPILVSLMDPTTSSTQKDTKRSSLVAITNLAAFHENHELIAGVGAITHLIKILRFEDSDEVKGQAAVALGNLASNETLSAVIGKAGAVEQLNLLVNSDSCSEITKVKVAGTLWNLVNNNLENKSIAVPGIPGLIWLCCNGPTAGREYASGALSNMAVVSSIAKEIVRAGGITPFVWLLKDSSPLIVQNACLALRNLAVSKSHKVLNTCNHLHLW